MNRELLQQARDALEDNRSGMAYIRQSHGDLYGVGWERAEQKAQKALAALDAELAKPIPGHIATLCEAHDFAQFDRATMKALPEIVFLALHTLLDSLQQPSYLAAPSLIAELAKPEPVDREEEIQTVLELARQYLTTHRTFDLDTTTHWPRLEAAVRALGVRK